MEEAFRNEKCSALDDLSKQSILTNVFDQNDAWSLDNIHQKQLTLTLHDLILLFIVQKRIHWMKDLMQHHQSPIAKHVMKKTLLLNHTKLQKILKKMQRCGALTLVMMFNWTVVLEGLLDLNKSVTLKFLVHLSVTVFFYRQFQNQIIVTEYMVTKK